MTLQQTAYQTNDLVWAKIQNYPWWPGKIVQIFQQKRSLIFRVSFYADPTYCYLNQSALIPFKMFQQQLNHGFQINSSLQRAINLANNAFQRLNISQKNKKALKLKQTVIELEKSQQQQILEQQCQKGQYFEQSTIHVHQEIEHNLKKNINPDDNGQIIQKCALLKMYRLDSIPKIVKKQIKMEQKKSIEKQSQQQIIQPSPSQQQSSDNEQIELFNPKIKQKKNRKSIRKSDNKKRKTNNQIKRKKLHFISKQEKKLNFMKKFCLSLIQRGFDSQISRQITIKLGQVIQKFIENHKSQQSFIKQQKFFLQQMLFKLYKTVFNYSQTSQYSSKEEFLVSIISSTQVLKQQMPESPQNEKQEQEKSKSTEMDSPQSNQQIQVLY